MQVSFTAHTPAHSPLTIQQRLEAAGFTNVHVNAISDTVEPFTRTNPETIQAYEEGKQLMEAHPAPAQPKRPEFLEPRYALEKPAGIGDNRRES